MQKGKYQLLDCYYQDAYKSQMKNQQNLIGITSTELKIAGKLAAVSLKSVMRKSINDGKFPDHWKISRVRALYKKGDTLERRNFRPISLLDIPGKILESLIADSVDYHMVNNLGRLYMHQWAFMKGCSTEPLLLHLTETWKDPIDKGKVVAVLIIDFQKAFDSVNHSILR